MIRRRIYLIFHFFFLVNFTTAYPKIFVKIQEPHESRNHYESVSDNLGYRNPRTYDDIELITKALEIVKQQKGGLSTVEINKCLYTYFRNTKQKFNCIKKLIYNDKTRNGNSKPYSYTKYLIKESLPDYKHKSDDRFFDLTKSRFDNDGKRSFQNMFQFSQDYLDINDLLRKETVEFVDDEPTESENKDDSRDPILIPIKNNNLREFSLDYLDTHDLLRRNTETFHEIPKQMNNTDNNKDSHGLNLVKPHRKSNESKSKKNLYVFKLVPVKNEIKDLRRFIGSNADLIKKKILRTVSDESDSSDESDEPQSIEVKVKRKEIKRKDKKPKRFQVIDKSVEEVSEEEDNTSNESDVPMQRPIEIPKKEKKLFYMQAPNRIFKIKNDGRRRLPHFLPKRYHWDEEDMRNLDSYWLNGPQGKHWGLYKTPH